MTFPLQYWLRMSCTNDLLRNSPHSALSVSLFCSDVSRPGRGGFNGACVKMEMKEPPSLVNTANNDLLNDNCGVVTGG